MSGLPPIWLSSPILLLSLSGYQHTYTLIQKHINNSLAHNSSHLTPTNTNTFMTCIYNCFCFSSRKRFLLCMYVCMYVCVCVCVHVCVCACVCDCV